MRPNVLFIYPDQMRADCMGVAGHPRLKTPALDRLSNEGVRFTNAYTSFPLCCPFRASIMTGKYATSHGMMANHYPINLNQTFLPQVMRDNGYSTCWVGKWHLNGGKKHDFVPKEYRLGFEHFVGFSRGHEYLAPIYYRDDNPQPFRSDMFEPELQTSHLCDFVDEASKQDRPFFAGICYGPPHTPVEKSPEHFRKLFSPEDVQLSELVPPGLAEEAKVFVAMYWGMIAAIDYQLLRIINHLENRQLLDNTLLILVSDHGDMCYEHGLTGKKSFYRGSMQVPLIVRYPQYGAGIVHDELVDPGVDLMPTILEACGISLPNGMEGNSLHRLMKNGSDPSLKQYVYYQIPRESDGPERFPFPERGLRTKEWLYVERCGVPIVLFDLVADPDEKCNLVSRSDSYPKVMHLREQLHAVMTLYHDNWDKHMDFPPVNFQSHEEGKAYARAVYDQAVYEEPW